MGASMKAKSVQESLQYVATHPAESVEPTVDIPTWEILGQILFEIANSPNPRVRGSMGRATKAQKIIADRLTGRRRPGTHPAQVHDEQIELADLTVGVLDDSKVGATDAGEDANV